MYDVVPVRYHTRMKLVVSAGRLMSNLRLNISLVTRTSTLASLSLESFLGGSCLFALPRKKFLPYGTGT